MPFFTSTIKKSFSGFSWVNSYQLEAADLTAAHSAMAGVINFEQTLHSTNVSFVLLRTAGYKSEDPNDFISTPLTGTGDVSQTLLSMCTPFTSLYLTWLPSGGRPGKKFYRYCLSNAEMYGNGDGASLNLTTARRDYIATAITALFDWMDTTAATLRVGVPDSAAGSRLVTHAAIAGVAQSDTHHGWFNKQSGS